MKSFQGLCEGAAAVDEKRFANIYELNLRAIFFISNIIYTIQISSCGD